MSSKQSSKPSPAYGKLEEADAHSTSTCENQYNLYSGVYEYPPRGGAQLSGNQYQPQYNIHVPGQVTTPVITQPGAMVLNRDPVTRNWMVPAVFSTLFCCLPIGIFAIMAASKANEAAAAGDVMEAERQSSRARTYVITSVIVGPIVIILYIVFKIYSHQNTYT